MISRNRIKSNEISQAPWKNGNKMHFMPNSEGTTPRATQHQRRPRFCYHFKTEPSSKLQSRRGGVIMANGTHVGPTARPTDKCSLRVPSSPSLVAIAQCSTAPEEWQDPRVHGGNFLTINAGRETQPPTQHGRPKKAQRQQEVARANTKIKFKFGELECENP